MGAMKPLIVILLLAISVQAQTLADAARKERERQAKFKPTRVIIAEGPRTVAAATDGAKTSAAQPTDHDEAEAGQKATTPAEQPAAAKPDPMVEYNAQLDKLRARIRQLQDQETALQLQVNQLTNQVFAPIIDPAAKDQAQARLGQVQQQLTSTRVELDQTKKTLDAVQLQGPPK